MRILITGGFGYLGGRLAQFLVNQVDHTILLGSRQQNKPPDWLPHVEVVQTQWDSPASLEQICIGVNAVVHLAGMNAQDCTADPAAALEVNGLATARLLNAAIKQRVKRFIYLSTAHIYGNPLAGVITEETCPTNLHPYATSHRAGEDVVRAAHQRGEIEGIVIRLSNGYGAPVHKDTNCWMLLVNDLCRQVATTHEMVLRSTGLQRRDFVPLTDACRAIGHLLVLPKQDLGRGTFNMGGKTASTVWEVACLIQARCEATLGFLPQLNRVAPQADEAIAELDYRLDALLQTGFQPSADRVEEIDQLIKFCKASFC